MAVAAETRTSAKNGTGPFEAIEDARDLIRWLRHNADTFNLDPNKITIGGAGGGAYLALLATMPKPKNLPPVDGLDCYPAGAHSFQLPWSIPPPRARPRIVFPTRKPPSGSARHSLIRRKLPPMIFFHGKSDRITPFEEVEKFRRRMRWRGNSCDLVDFERADHSFFNFNVSHKNFESTISAADQFLVDHGQLAPPENPDFF